MGKDSRRRAKKESRRRRRIASACSRDDAARPPTSILDVPDDLLELVLLRVHTPTCLFRAAATCKPWRRVVIGSGFLRRFRELHGQHLLLGHYCVNAKKMEDGIERLNAEFFPSPPWPTNHLRQRLSLDFLPQSRPYSHNLEIERVLSDSRGGLLAFVQDNWYAVVCDPWTKQYRELHFPWGQEEDDNSRYYWLGAFLLDAADGGDNGSSPMSSFTVLCACLVRDDYDWITAQACVFSARQNRWLRPSVTNGPFDWSLVLVDSYKRILGRAGGSIFWFGSSHNGYVLALDENTGEFSTFWLPPLAPNDDIYGRAGQLYHKHNVRVVGGGGAVGAMRIVRLLGGDLEVLTRAHGAYSCTVERRVGVCQLANIEDTPNRSWRWSFEDTDTTQAPLLALVGFCPSSTLFFSLDVETMKLQRLNDRTRTLNSASRVFPYEIPWSQTISACL